jgi:hypothetical protein
MKLVNQACQPTPLMTTFQGGIRDNVVHTVAKGQVEALERMCGTPIYNHLIVKAPEAEGAGFHEASLYLTMPGHIDIRVEPTEHPDHRFADPNWAIVDVFQRARGLIAERLAPRRRKARRPAVPLR